MKDELSSRVVYVGRLTLRETLGSFVARQWGLARQQSFVLVYGALISIVLSLLFVWLRRRRASVAVASTTASVPKSHPGRARKKRKKRRQVAYRTRGTRSSTHDTVGDRLRAFPKLLDAPGYSVSLGHIVGASVARD